MTQTQPQTATPIDPGAADLAAAAARAAAARKAEDVCVYDLHVVSSFCDAFIVCHGTNRRQVTAIAQGVIDDLRARGVRPTGVEGMEAGRWVLIDFGEIIVHVFDEPMRGFYDLDGLWGDAPRIAVDLTPPSAAAPA
ncbi:MAG: ribosome silencing factor [Myxococcales bacterium]|nr:ribosome silencing factor [Myxococcales bacterium]